jgi:Ran GTPase-activating protein (RanGAP) involved in mRNA processing and transport/preprotein translocase subunit Sec61beta
MDRDIPDILVDIKKKYRGLNVHQRSTYHLRGVANLELEKSDGIACANHPVHIRYQNIFKWHDPTKRLSRKVVFVEGEAGMGKTVLCTLIAKDWASGDLFQEFIVVLLLPLNCRNVATACSLPMLLSELYNLDERKCHILASYLTGPQVIKNVLIIADGLDQMSEPGLCEGSFLHRLLFDNVLAGPPSSCVTAMITSRPNRGGVSLPSINRRVYVKGFSIDSVQLCVRSEFDNAADEAIASYLMQQIDNNPMLQSICSVPLNLAMILKLFPSIPRVHDQPLPDTLTGLYTKLCWAHAESSIRHIEQYKSVESLSSYRDLPEDLQELWWLLCELAFRSIESGSNSSQLVSRTTVLMSVEVVSFGFLKPVSENNEVANFKFLHPAFEQYLAVLHLVKQSQDVQLEFIETYSSDRTLSYYFWQFFFGMYANKDLNSEVKPDDNTIIVQATQMLSNLYQAGNNNYLLCHCSFEAKCKVVNDEIINALSSTKDKSLPMTLYFNNARNAHDCVAMIYVIESMDQQCCVRINFQKCNLRCQHVNELASVLSFRASNIQVKELDLSDNILDDSTLADFFHKAASTLQSLEVLSLRSCGVENKAVNAIMNVFSSQSLWQLDLSYNPLSEFCLGTVQNLLLRGTLVKLEMLSLKGSLPKDISLKLDFLASFMGIVSCQCQNLRQLDLSDNYLGESDNPIISKMILQLTTDKSRLDLRLNDEYMSIVDENIISAMESCIKNKGTIDHTVAHGIIVGPGRSGKNTLMSRLMGKGPPDPKVISSSTGVAEKVVKVEVRNTCTVAATACNLKWQRLECDEEALELMMSTAKYHSVGSSVPPKSKRPKYIRNPKQSKDGKANRNQPLASSKSPEDQVSPEGACQSYNDSAREDENTNKTMYIRSSDVAPVELLKNALRLRKINGLREQLESSWSLYLTNTGGQPEFQEYLPFLISGPTMFFITFPLHRDLNEPYTIEYQYPDGRVKSYPSPTTLLEELLQTLATINALRYTVVYENERHAEVRPKVFFIGTHKDCLQDANTIHEIDKQIRKFVEQTPLYRMIQFAETSKQMIFTINNLSESDDDFQKLRTKVQKTVTERCFEEFTIKCPTSWLVFSLILREKYQPSRVLHIDDCLVIARECGISSSKEMKRALSFIHSRLGLVRYYDTEELNTLVVVDPQIIFDKISELTISTFINDPAEEYEIEDFKHKGIFSETLMKKVSDKCCSSSQQLLSFTWLADLLNYLRIAALFKDLDGTRKYFFPSALTHAPESSSKLAQTISPVLVAFKGGFCPRGISGALIKCLMTNEMKSKQKWRLLTKKIFRNQVSFRIQGCGTITLKILPTHLEICVEDTTDHDLKAICEEAYTQIEKCIEMVTSQCIKCKHFWRFYCTVAECETNPHPAEIEWSRSGTAKELWCKFSENSGVLPNGYEIWNIQRKQRKALMLGK